jgi:hypothetical protein
VASHPIFHLRLQGLAGSGPPVSRDIPPGEIIRDVHPFWRVFDLLSQLAILSSGFNFLLFFFALYIASTLFNYCTIKSFYTIFGVLL